MYNIDELLKEDKLSLMMKQYLECKKKYMDCILLYRLGDFYEMFFDDALTASNVLEITLTNRSCGLENKAPMCGIPYHAIDSYITKLIECGFKVAIGEQLENPKDVKGIVKRDVIRVITPGTVIDEGLLENTSNYLMSIYLDKETVGLSYLDINVGDIYSTKINKTLLSEEISKLKPSEIIVSDNSLKEYLKRDIISNNIYINDADVTVLDFDVVLKYFDKVYIDSLDLDETDLIKHSLEILLNYVYYTQKKVSLNINSINIYDVSKYMVLDSFTRESLELTKRSKTNEKNGSLFSILDKTNTAMGSRLLKSFIEQPLIEKKEIEERLNFVEELKNDDSLRLSLSDVLKHVYDIERLCGKIAFEKINPRELINLKKSIENLPLLKHLINTSDSVFLKNYVKDLDDLRDIFKLIDDSILDDPLMTILDGGIIKESYNNILLKYHNTISHMNENLAKLEEEQQEKLGIKSLKLRHNNDGYYMEVTKNALNAITLPDEYKKVRDLATSFRFTFEGLRSLELDILEAQDKSKTLEYDIFIEIRNEIIDNIARIKKAAKILSKIDVYISLAQISIDNNYVRPAINEENILEIIDGRHPIIENISDIEFISNNTFMNGKDELIHLITGPNMAGKSTYMRQVVLINLLAQIGSFVPASKANISIRDRIFTRIGASDNLLNKESTFMVEMNEVAQILNNATNKSLIILDEVGRGTSTYDGISLAWSIVEYIESHIKCNTIFATHYFELTELADKFKDIKNYTVAIEEIDNEIHFLRKIISGCTNQSYGIYVAQFAKLPDKVINRAKEILIDLEKNDGQTSLNTTIKEVSNDSLKEDILSLNLLEMNPLEVFNYLYKLQSSLK